MNRQEKQEKHQKELSSTQKTVLMLVTIAFTNIFIGVVVNVISAVVNNLIS